MEERYKLLNDRVKEIFCTTGPGHHFFGYYDKSPFDRTGERLLSLRVDFNDRLPEADDCAEIGYWEIKNRKFVPLTETRAFNWQQGCMLQWLGPTYDRYIIFNDRQGGRFVSVILDIATGESVVIPIAIYAVHPEGRCALAVDFERLYFPRRAYSYAGIEKEEKSADLVEGDGIWFVDLKKRDVEQIISAREMYERNHLSSMEGGPNYLEHLLFNPSGTRFLFLHRWVLEDGGIYSRVYTSDVRGRDIRCLLDSGVATHYCWHGDTHILMWGAPPSAINRWRRNRLWVKSCMRPLLPLYRRVVRKRSRIARAFTGMSYLYIEDSDEQKVERFAQNILTADGHPSWNPIKKDWLLSDTYQDDDYYQSLYLFDAKRGVRVDIGRFFIPESFCNSPIRCDLHPRWDRDGSLVCIDSLHSGARQMHVFDVTACMEG